MCPQNGTIYGAPRQLPWLPAHFFGSGARCGPPDGRPEVPSRAALPERQDAGARLLQFLGPEGDDGNMTWKHMGTGAFGSTRP